MNLGKFSARSFAAVAALALLCGCVSMQTAQPQASPASDPSHTPTTQRTQPSSSSSRAFSSKELCEVTFPGELLVAWADGTVGGFRDWHYGGPTPTYPVPSAFPDASVETVGAWCYLERTKHTNGWWITIPGAEPSLVLRMDPDVKRDPHWQGEIKPPVIP